MGNQFSQHSNPTAKFSEEEASGASLRRKKVFIVTDASSGVDRKLAQLLYSLDTKIYLAGSSREQSEQAISEILTALPDSKGELYFLEVNLEDLDSIKAAAAKFLSKESQLDALWNDTGVILPSPSKTEQGHDLQLGVKCLAASLFGKIGVRHAKLPSHVRSVQLRSTD